MKRRPVFDLDYIMGPKGADAYCRIMGGSIHIWLLFRIPTIQPDLDWRQGDTGAAEAVCSVATYHYTPIYSERSGVLYLPTAHDALTGRIVGVANTNGDLLVCSSAMDAKVIAPRLLDIEQLPPFELERQWTTPALLISKKSSGNTVRQNQNVSENSP
jgi:hypothetical protein